MEKAQFTDDVREAPSLSIFPVLMEAGAAIRAADPKGIEESKRVLGNVRYNDDPFETAEGADAIVIMPRGTSTGRWTSRSRVPA